MGPSAAAAGTGTPNHAAKHRSKNKAFHRQIPDLIDPSLAVVMVRDKISEKIQVIFGLIFYLMIVNHFS
jgi:hypothetical protein